MRSTWSRFWRTRSAQAASSSAAVAVVIASRYVGRTGPGFPGRDRGRGLGEPVEVGAGVDVRVCAVERHVPDELRMRPEHRPEAVIAGQLVGEAPDLAPGEDRVRGGVRGIPGDHEWWIGALLRRGHERPDHVRADARLVAR